MDLRYTEEEQAFRGELRAWLADAVPSLPPEPDPDDWDARRAYDTGWQRMLFDAGYAGINWPKEYGGRGATPTEHLIYIEETERARAPYIASNFVGQLHAGPTLIAEGSPDQKAKHLPAILRGDDIWCQGFSEPNAGSDLASLRTTAVRDGDCWVVNGQKTWNTLGHLANWCELLVRTNTEVPKHKGITCLLVDMTLPGVEVRPLVTITGDKEFNEIFFTDVRVPLDCTLGPVNEGWRVAMTTLAYERGTVAKLHTGTRGKIARLIDEARTTPLGDGRMATDDPVLREKLAAAYLDGELLKLISDRALSAELHGKPMGPEGSIAKLLWSETEQHVTELASDVLGPDALRGPWARDRVYSRALTIAGGTTQVNKNILAQRMLGLPRR